MGQRLYLVTLQGMTTSTSGAPHGKVYVIASSPSEAYAVVRLRLEKNDIGFEQDRQLRSVELLAEDEEYTACPMRLFICREK